MSEPSTYEAAMNRIAQLEAELRISEDARAIANKLRARPDDALLDRIRTLETALREIRHAWLKLSELTGRQYDLARLDLFNVIDATTSAALSPETPEVKP